MKASLDRWIEIEDCEYWFEVRGGEREIDVGEIRKQLREEVREEGAVSVTDSTWKREASTAFEISYTKRKKRGGAHSRGKKRERCHQTRSGTHWAADFPVDP